MGGGGQMIMRGGPGGGGFGGPGGFGGFGGGDAKHKYNVTIDLRAQNVLNHTNFDRFNGTLPQLRDGVLQPSRFGTPRAR